MKKKAVWFPIAMFLSLLFGGMLWGIGKEDRAYSDTENRYLAARPEFSWDALFNGSFTQDYEKYITDQFPGREDLVGLKTHMERILGKIETKGVWLAAEGYLIVNDPAEDFEGVQAEKNIRSLEKAIQYYSEELGEDHVRVLLVPTAGQILVEKLPRYGIRYDQSEYLARVQAVCGSAYVDLEQVLSAHAEEYIFYRTDHHWTTLGAFYAYQVWAASLGSEPAADPALRVVSEDFLGTTWSKLHALGQPDVISVYDTTQSVILTHNQAEQTEGFYDWEALQKRDQYAVFLGGNEGLLEITGKDAAGEDAATDSVLLVVKDSFANCFLPYAANHYDRIVVADLRYLNMSLQAVAAAYGVTDLLVLYHTQAFATDPTVFRIAR